jgi:GH15 family glucan-1,4-alpha-glucosidase
MVDRPTTNEDPTASSGHEARHRIEDYAIIGDLHTAALIARDGSIEWLCLPRFDSAACFAALLADDDAGFWRIAPTDAGACDRRRYRDHTLILESEWDTPGGTVRVTDTMPPRDGAADVVRVVEGISGTVEMTMSLRLRFDYGHITPWVRTVDGDLSAVAGPDSTWLRTPVEVTGQDLTSSATFTVNEGDRVPFVLTYVPSHEPRPRPVDPVNALERTEKFWTDWVAGSQLEGPHSDLVAASLVVLKALTYAPTGGIVAAATTSLPEQLGGPRNWDYRYCWLRDATFVLEAFITTGHVDEARAWRQWLLRAVAGDPADLQIMYGVDGRRRLTELSLDWLSGYAGSTPVRTGNAASTQLQLDVWGEVLDCLHVSRVAGLDTDDEAWDVQLTLLDFVEKHWMEPDNGLWEIRGQRRHFVHSKVMSWVAMDRGVQAVETFGLDGPADRWRDIRQQIHDEVSDQGYDTERRTFTQFYGSNGLDASLLLLGKVGFLPWTDERMIGTVDAVQRELLRDGVLRRYDPAADGGVDGLPGGEGTFIACTFWLVEALQNTGRPDQAHALFDELTKISNDLGLFSEEYDVSTGHQLGNMPQAYSHVGLINAARALNPTPERTAS